jgi:RHS repeat-associated protein
MPGAGDVTQNVTHADGNGEMSTALPGGWIGDPSSSVGPDNLIGYAGYVFNPEREDYSVRFRVYSPELGRWRQQDALGFVDGSSLYAYVASPPARFIDPSGLKLRVVNPHGDDIEHIEKAIKDICPAAEIDPATGDVTIDCSKPGSVSEGCDCLAEAVNSNRENTIEPSAPPLHRLGPATRPTNRDRSRDGTGSPFRVLYPPGSMDDLEYGPGDMSARSQPRSCSCRHPLGP